MAANGCRLDEYALEKILKMLKAETLWWVRSVCSRWNEKVIPVMDSKINNSTSDILNMKDREGLSLSEKVKISCYRKKGIYRESILDSVSKRQKPWMQCDKGNLHVSSGNVIQCYETRENEQSWTKTTRYKHKKNVTKFVIKDNPARIVSGCLDGHIYVWGLKGKVHIKLKDVNQHIPYSVDHHGSIVVSGSRNRTLEVFRLQSDDRNRLTGWENIHSFVVGDEVWSLTISQCGSFCACGLKYNSGDALLSLMDLHKQTVCHFGKDEFEIGEDIVLDMQYMTQDTLLTCGNVVRLWDIRNNRSECTLNQTFNGSYDPMFYYCVSSDGVRNIYAGSHNGFVNYWDTRFANRPVQTLDIGKKDVKKVSDSDYKIHRRNSPVFSLDFDSKRLYAALAQNVKILDYSEGSYKY